MPVEFECRYEGLSGSRALVTAVGELDIYTHPQFKEALDAAARSDADQLVVDLSGVTFMDSSALTILLSEQRRRADRMHLVITEPQLLRILEVMGYMRIFAVHATLEDAVQETGRLRASRAQPNCQPTYRYLQRASRFRLENRGMSLVSGHGNWRSHA